MTNNRAAVYARVSKNREDDAAKPQRQIKSCALLGKAKGLTLVAEPFVDDDVSAYKGKVRRPAYEALLEAIRRGEVDVVLTWNIDRMLRSTSQMLAFIALAEETGCRIESVQGGSLDLSTPAGRMVATILASVAQAEVELKAERHNLKNQQTRAAGGSTGGPTPFGWESSDGALHPTQGPALATAIRDLIEGVTLSTIARNWNDAGLRTTFGNPWNHNSVKKVLVRPRNAGLIDHQGVVLDGVEARWEAAVSVEEWRAAKEILDGQRRPRAAQKHLLSNLITCEKCGGRMVAGIAANKGHRYAVYKHASSGGERVTCGTTIRQEVTDKVVRSAVRYVLTWTPVETLAPGADVTQAVALRNEQADLRQKMDDLESLWSDGLFSTAKYRAERETLQEAQNGLSERLAAIVEASAFAAMLGASEGVYEAPIATGVNVGEKFDSLDLAQRRLIVSTIFPEITIGAGKGADRISLHDAQGELFVLEDDAA